ncbi:MAG: LysM peptidoglycan-binding domain-containing M23 family metallopeptidase [Patescibacteria group bacterium]|nr:MAG: LysM peptidoglycan-binding domain-containing M23 family metallopeptidase [Patescibacteria group bacterium]
MDRADSSDLADTARFGDPPETGEPPLSLLSGQLKLGLMEEDKKETVWEDLFAFGRDFLFYLSRRTLGALSWLGQFIFSGFTLTSSLKFWLSRKFVRRKGQLSFPFAHATLIGVSLSLLVVTAGLGDLVFQKSDPVLSGLEPTILESKPELITIKSELTRNEATAYTVEEGEDIYDIAAKFSIAADALAYTNRLPYPYSLSKGQKITIPPYQGVVHEVIKDITVAQLAKANGANPQAIIDLNYLFPSKDGVYRLTVGQIVTIPTYKGELLGTAVSPKGSCEDLSLVWPTPQRGINQYWRPWHTALDIEANVENLFAAADGTVAAIGSTSSWNQGYGGSVFINLDGTGYQLRYAHMSETIVAPGQKVEAGETIGKAGATGKAFGVHLHFELLCNGEKIDPYYYLPK